MNPDSDPRQARLRRLVLTALATAAVIAALLLVGCSTLGYYAHVTRGHAELMSQRQPIEELVADPATDPVLRAQLEPILAARRFASERLLLPSNRSYTLYSDIGRRFVSWNVFAAPEFSIDPVLHCFPVAGCVAYRGYFDEARARAEAARLAAQGHETYIGGVRAYSTLGWFDDPVLSSMPLAKTDELVGIIFHELAHQQTYVPGDTPFNESLASFIEQQGLREWQQARGEPPGDAAADDYRPVIERVLALRERLAGIYAQSISDEAKRARKQAAIEDFREEYRRWRAGEGQGRAAFDGWVAAPIDNAKLVPMGLYDRWLPAFEALFDEVGSDWAAFHAQVDELAELPAAQREARLQALLAGDQTQEETDGPKRGR